MKKTQQFKRNIYFLYLIVFLASSLVLAEKNDSKTKQSLEAIDPVLGVDQNSNHIRDEIEKFIKNHPHIKDHKLQKLYLNLAETVSLQLRYRFNKKKLKKLDDQYFRDRFCILGVDTRPEAKEYISHVNDAIVDTPLRREARYQMFMTLEVSEFKQFGKENWSKLCRE